MNKWNRRGLRRNVFTRSFLSLTAGCICFTTLAGAARAPNAVECTLEMKGEGLAALAKLFGLTDDGSHVELPLGEGTAWAVYLLKQDTPVKLSNAQGQPPRFNRVSFQSQGGTAVQIGPFWQDMGTAAPNSRPGVYEFFSDTFPEALTGTDPWISLIRELKSSPSWRESATRKSGQRVFEKSFRSDDGSSLVFSIVLMQTYTNNVSGWGYVASVSATPRKPCPTPVP